MHSLWGKESLELENKWTYSHGMGGITIGSQRRQKVRHQTLGNQLNASSTHGEMINSLTSTRYFNTVYSVHTTSPYYCPIKIFVIYVNLWGLLIKGNPPVPFALPAYFFSYQHQKDVFSTGKNHSPFLSKCYFEQFLSVPMPAKMIEYVCRGLPAMGKWWVGKAVRIWHLLLVLILVVHLDIQPFVAAIQKGFKAPIMFASKLAAGEKIVLYRL